MPFPVFESYVKGLVSPTPSAQQRFFEGALKQAPHDPRMLMALWGVYAAQGQNEKALAVASGVSKDSPLSRKARFLAALSLIELSRFDGAAEQLTALNRERPSPVLSNALGIVQLRRPNGASAAAPFFNRAVDAESGEHRLPLQSRLRPRARAGRARRALLAAGSRALRRRQR